MRRIFLTLVVFCSMMIIRCGETSKKVAPPWTDSQIERMENDEIETVPFFHWTF